MNAAQAEERDKAVQDLYKALVRVEFANQGVTPSEELVELGAREVMWQAPSHAFFLFANSRHKPKP